jgi:hypothetical protein
MRQVRIQRDFHSFRAAARSLLARDIEPNGIAWVDENEPTLLEDEAVAQLSTSISVSHTSSSYAASHHVTVIANGGR